MNDAIKLQLSAFIDGELPENESELLLLRLGQDGALRQQVEEYLRIGRLLRGERDLPGMGELRGRVAEALGAEPLPTAPVEDFVPSRFMRPVAGVAIAASVAVLALIGLRQVGSSGESEFADGSADFAAVAIDDASMYTEQLSNEFVTDGPSDRVTQYYRRHEERSPGSGANILTRLVTLELREGQLVEIEPRADPEIEDETLPVDAIRESSVNQPE
jgi:sigma-E factor negative regulatory protein RseA